MKLHFFFSGKLGREEAASAFLATMLEQSAEFRRAFFSLLENQSDLVDSLCAEDWTVKTEENQVDVTMHSKKSNTMVLIENKIQSASKMAGQVNRYYKQCKKDFLGKNIYAVYLAPASSMGQSEIDKVDFGCGDKGVSLGWEDIFSTIETETFNSNESIDSCMESIRSIVKTNSETKFPIEGTRAIVHEILVSSKRDVEDKYPDIALTPWRNRDSHTIFTNKTNLTIYMKLSFPSEEDPPYLPIISPDNPDIIKMKAVTSFKISGRGKKSAECKAWWNEQLKNEYFGNGDAAYRLDENKIYFVNSIDVCGAKEEVQKAFTSRCLSTIDRLKANL